MVGTELSQDLAIKSDALLFQGAHELGVGGGVGTGGGVDADLRQRAAVTLFQAAIAVSVRAALRCGCFSESDFALATPHHSFCAGQDILASLDAMHSTFYARHMRD